MDSGQDLQAKAAAAPPARQTFGLQSDGFLLELSADWIVRRASENVHHLLGHSHVTLIDEPLGRFVHSQALHDLRNLFSRLSGTTGIARAYCIRLTDEAEYFDVAFQMVGSRVLLEAVPRRETKFGEAFGTVGGLIAGLADSRGQALLDGAARRMRALTGYDRVTLFWDGTQFESTRGSFAESASAGLSLPPIIADIEQDPVGIFPREDEETSVGSALMRAAAKEAVTQLQSGSIRASLTIPINLEGTSGEFRCDSRTPRRPSFELHAAAELFAQLFALRLQVDRLRSA